MTIMVAGGMTLAIPGMTPVAEAATDGRLTVSADGNFAGIQVIEIKVDGNESDLNTNLVEPSVEIDGNTVRMVQSDDGNWYAYVASSQGIDA